MLPDQNISFRITNKIQDIFPDSKQVRDPGLEDSKDSNLWTFARKLPGCVNCDFLKSVHYEESGAFILTPTIAKKK